MAHFHITVVTHEHVPVEQSERGQSYGQLLDELLLTKAHNGEMVQAFELFLDERDWMDFAAKAPTLSGSPPPRKAAPRAARGTGFNVD